MEFKRWAIITSALLLHLTKPISGLSSLVNIKGDQYDAIHGMWCPSWRNYICGTDGITYWNECMFLASKNSKGVEIQKMGSCDDLECEECDEEVQEPEGVLEVCGANAQIFKTRCQFECHLDTYPMLTEVYDHCRRGFPTKQEVELATPDMYKLVFDAYTTKYVDIINSYSFQNVSMKKMNFDTEINGDTVKIACKRVTISDFSSIKSIDQFLFYSYNDVYGRTKIIFELGFLELRIKRFRATGPGLRIKGRLKLQSGKNRFELVAETSSSPSENYCPIVHAISLRLVDVDDVTVTLKPALPPKASDFPVDGLIKEKLMDIVNDMIAPRIVDKLAEIPCLKSDVNREKKCFGFFQARMCF